MSYSTVNYYQDELTSWIQTLEQVSLTIMELEGKLYAVIERNTIPNQAHQAEDLMNQLARLRIDMATVTTEISEQELKLQKDHTPVEDSALTDQVKSNQDAIRKGMKTIRHNFSDQQDACEHFLASVFGK